MAETAVNIYYVYVHRRLDTLEVFYVGKGSTNRAWVKFRKNYHWKSIVEKHGYSVEIVKDGMHESCSFALERLLIAKYRSMGINLANKTDGGEGTSGYIWSDQDREKHSEAQRGKSMPDWWPQYVSDRFKGRIITQEHRDKLSKANTGKKRTPEMCEEISVRNSGMNSGRAIREIFTFFHDDGRTFTGFPYEFRMAYGIASDGLSRVLSGKRNHVGGWRVKNDQG